MNNKGSFILFLILSIFPAFSSAYPRNDPKAARPNVLLITIDTLRADRLGCYSGRSPKTPHIDSLAESGVLFSKAFALTPTTLPSHTNILLGTTPLVHGIHDAFDSVVDARFLTLAEHLKTNGYATGAFVGSFRLDARFGLSQGFDVYDDDYQSRASHKNFVGERKAEAVISQSLGWLKNQRGPWFLWVHCFDPHDPYDPPEPFRSQYQNPYDGEVAYVDSALGRLFQYLEDSNLFRQSLIVLTGDHGESLGQHGESTHGFLAYNATLWIPLIIKAPGLKKAVVGRNVSHLDIFPTVCDFLGLERPDFLQGISLLPALKGKTLPSRALYFEALFPFYNRGWAPLTGYISENEKFMDSPIPEYFDLDKDFDELHNLAGSGKMDGYRKNLVHLIERLTPSPKDGTVEANKKIDRETLEKLASLGYLASPSASLKKDFGPEDDVKTLLPYYNRAVEAVDIGKRGKIEEAIRMLKAVIQENKRIDVAYKNLADLYLDQKKIPEALGVLKTGLENVPASYFLFSAYINNLVAAGRFGEVVEAVNKSGPPPMENDAEIWSSLGYAYLMMGNYDMSLKAYRRAVSIDEKYVSAWSNLGTVHLTVFQKIKNPKSLQDALQSYRRALDLNPKHAPSLNGLGNVCRQEGDIDRAISYFEKALQVDPGYSYALFNLCQALLDKGNKASALRRLSEFKQEYYGRLPDAEKKKLDELLLKCGQEPR